ncbi:MAG: 50S ribosomal protein L11 [Candidatus Methanomethylicia archaeon]|nr:50S ribosomal protein L11 [Candidatus Methanomethylicia archaeon]MCX8169291.1 50S ribosomal protein L11 [Candidatus Methanomethylicia archaeon]MDW7988926.1 50S ribosomal protein L11 [Nitrososphaerota archaeon]
MKSSKRNFTFLIEGGKATGGPPIGPSLGPLGVNVMQVVNLINEKTKEFLGMRVPVTVTVDIETKEFIVEVGIPTTAALILRELKVEKGSGSPHEKKIGDLTMHQVIKIAKIKRPQLLAKTLKAAVKEILGTCVSMGVLIEGKSPKIIQQEIDKGVYDEMFREEEG